MNTPTRISLVVLLAVTAAGCATHKNARALEAEERLLIYSERPLNNADNARKIKVMCAEPSPDALKTLAASMNVEKQEVATIAAAYSEAGANIGLRTHTIQLLRDQLFAICQGFANEGISAPAYQMMLTRNQRNTVALMAIEQLTGVLKTPSVKLSGSASIGPNKELIDLNKKLKDAAEAKLKAVPAADKDKPETIALKKEIENYDAAIAKAEKAIVAAATATDAQTIQGGGADQNTVSAVTATVKSITDQILGQNDNFYVCLDAYQTAKQYGVAVPTEIDTRCKKIFADESASAKFYALKSDRLLDHTLVNDLIKEAVGEEQAKPLTAPESEAKPSPITPTPPNKQKPASGS
ncbi:MULTISPECIES: hypothetical protein [unclassified Pseudomonas]|uniref:hypothetical protein n=1 Tax=unclassified Pseudomonas TaxID=196821 RepID=UPI0011B6CD8D|nr:MULTISPECIES: hypothetical protein [unclassified Pseudomonas]MDW3711165.1 hypothetical protein [Pseudomonas sp. 2023EL-01195]